MNKRISVVIAAYNEEPRIAEVLKAVEHHPLIDEVIVVNDGSKDKTSEVVKRFDVKLIENEKNMGKTLSIKRGVEAAKNEIIMLLDADLVDLSTDSIIKLAKPVLDGRVDWTLSLRRNSFGFVKILKLTKVDWLSGDRVIAKTLLSDPLIWSKPNIGYGLEVLMNKSFLGKKATFQSVYLSDVHNPGKTEKNGFLKGLHKQYNMVVQISKAVPLFEVILQLIKMAYLNRKYSRDYSKELATA